ncbi:hypothetical protein T484DRAFT_1929436 [Baffinella frigidus]|nr:hypothetical protein T484DRAFT_1929436 [Cryptophyta sp. CCMP2293]
MLESHILNMFRCIGDAPPSAPQQHRTRTNPPWREGTNTRQATPWPLEPLEFQPPSTPPRC